MTIWALKQDDGAYFQFMDDRFFSSRENAEAALEQAVKSNFNPQPRSSYEIVEITLDQPQT